MSRHIFQNGVNVEEVIELWWKTDKRNTAGKMMIWQNTDGHDPSEAVISAGFAANGSWQSCCCPA